MYLICKSPIKTLKIFAIKDHMFQPWVKHGSPHIMASQFRCNCENKSHYHTLKQKNQVIWYNCFILSFEIANISFNKICSLPKTLTLKIKPLVKILKITKLILLLRLVTNRQSGQLFFFLLRWRIEEKDWITFFMNKMFIWTWGPFK